MTAQQAEQVSDAIAAELDHDGEFEFMGRWFRVADKMGLMPYLRFAHIAKLGVEKDDLEAMAATYDVLAQAVHPDDWEAFCQHATETRADEDEIIKAVHASTAVMSARPQVRPSDSSVGPQDTETSSSAGLSSPVSLTPRQAQLREHLKLMPPVDQIGLPEFGVA